MNCTTLRICLVQLCLMLLTITGKAQEARKFETYFAKLENNRGFSGDVLVADSGRIIYRGSFGYADFKTHRRNLAGTAFPIASLSKTITAIAILQLAERGKLSITDQVDRYLAGFPYHDITIQHLLSHTSGLPPYNSFFDPILAKTPGRVFRNTDFMPAAIAVKPALIYQPGDKGNYDNVNYLVLSLIIEKVSGESYPAYVREHILKPAGMTHTRFMKLSDQFNSDTLKNFAYPHLYPRSFDEAPVRSGSIPYVRDYWHTYAVSGFGDYISTVEDLLLYDRALFHHRLLKPQTLAKVFEVVKLNSGKPNPELFGLGWEIEPDSSRGKVIYHSGAATGLSCVLIHNLAKDQTIILYDNVHYNAHEIGDQALSLLNGQPIAAPKASIARIYGITLNKKGPAAAKALLQKLKKDTTNYELSESEMNQLGYDFLGNTNTYHVPEWHLYPQALETLKLNTELFPGSWNVFDSYGEALVKAGQLDKGAEMYRRSIQLNPDNKGGIKALEMIGHQKKVN